MEYFFGGLVLLVALYGVTSYNGFVGLKHKIEEAEATMDVYLKKRSELIPNLVETVKGYASHEKETFQNVTEARTKAMQAESPQEKAQAENFLSETLKSLFAVSENYPDLKANENFLELQRELTDTENKIQASRRFYNGNVRDYNTKIETVPTNIIASIFNFATREFFELDEAEKESAKNPVKVEF